MPALVELGIDMPLSLMIQARRDDRISADFVALHEAAFGTKRTLGNLLFVRF
jgi:hypothetical protein